MRTYRLQIATVQGSSLLPIGLIVTYYKNTLTICLFLHPILQSGRLNPFSSAFSQPLGGGYGNDTQETREVRHNLDPRCPAQSQWQAPRPDRLHTFGSR